MTKKYKLIYQKKYIKDLKHIPSRIQDAIESAVKDLSDNPRPHGYLKLKGYDELYRIRVGDYRIIYSIIDSKLVILVIEVGDRKDVYK